MEHFSLEVADHIATVTIQSTTMPPAFFRECEELFGDINARDDIHAVVIRSGVKAFTYGLDLPAAFAEHGQHFMGTSTAGPRLELLALVERLQRAFNAIADCPVPTIAALHGWCIGGGLDLAAACDMRLASEDATISLRETRIAIVADLGSLQRLQGIIGKGHLRELAFTGKDVSAARAAEIGLVNHVYPDKDALWEAANAMASDIASNPALVVRGVKDVLDYSEEHSVADGLKYVAVWNSAFLASEDLGEAAAAFMEKRAPKFKGK